MPSGIYKRDYDKIYTKERGDKIRNALKSRKLPIEQKNLLRELAKKPERLKISMDNLPKDCKKEKNGNWKGGFEYFQNKWGVFKHYNQSPEYKIWRSEVFKRDNWTCQTCQARSTYLEAHHIKSYTKFPQFRFDIDNGVTLCRECHNLTKKKNI